MPDVLDACPVEAYLRYLPLSRRSCLMSSSKAEGHKFQKFEVFCSELFHTLEEETSASSVLESLGETSGDYKSLSTNSKSGEFFFLSRDRKFLIKTVSEAEGRLLFRMLPEYQDHIHSSPMSLIVRFAGLYRVEIAKGSWKYFLLMMLFLHPVSFSMKVEDSALAVNPGNLFLIHLAKFMHTTTSRALYIIARRRTDFGALDPPMFQLFVKVSRGGRILWEG